MAAFTDREALSILGPPGSDAVSITGRELFERAEGSGDRVIVASDVDAGALARVVKVLARR